jgi:WD40 repeat protein
LPSRGTEGPWFPLETITEGKIYDAALSPDERYLAVGGWMGASPHTGEIRIHDFRTGEVLALLVGHSNVVHTLAFSADGRWLASGSGDNTVRLWDTAGWKPIQELTGHKDDVDVVSFSPDSGTLVSGSFDMSLRLWDRASGRLLKEMTGHQQKVRAAAFSPDGLYIASGGDDRTVKLWDGHSGAFIRDLATQGSFVDKVAFSPDGRMLLTAGGPGDKVCHIFEVSTGREIAHFSKHTKWLLLEGAIKARFLFGGRRMRPYLTNWQEMVAQSGQSATAGTENPSLSERATSSRTRTIAAHWKRLFCWINLRTMG